MKIVFYEDLRESVEEDENLKFLAQVDDVDRLDIIHSDVLTVQGVKYRLHETRWVVDAYVVCELICRKQVSPPLRSREPKRDPLSALRSTQSGRIPYQFQDRTPGRNPLQGGSSFVAAKLFEERSQPFEDSDLVFLCEGLFPGVPEKSQFLFSGDKQYSVIYAIWVPVQGVGTGNVFELHVICRHNKDGLLPESVEAWKKLREGLKE